MILMPLAIHIISVYVEEKFEKHWLQKFINIFREISISYLYWSSFKMQINYYTVGSKILNNTLHSFSTLNTLWYQKVNPTIWGPTPTINIFIGKKSLPDALAESKWEKYIKK